MQEKLLKAYRGEDDIEESKDGGIDVERLEQLLEKVNLEVGTEGSDVFEELGKEEKKQFEQFLKTEASKAIELWEPWWLHRQLFATQAITEVDDSNKGASAQDYNLNRFG